MNDLESVVRRVIREELQAVLEELLPRFLSQSSKEHIEPEEELLLSTREAAMRLSISERTLYSITKSGELPCVRFVSGKRYSIEALKAWIQKAEAESTSSPSKPSRMPNTETPKPGKPTVKRTGSKKAPAKKTPSRSKAGSPVNDKPINQLKQHDEAQHPNPLDLLLDEIGVDRDVVLTMTRGELRQIAGVDISTYHSWRFHGRAMPDEAIEKLRQYFRQLGKSE